VKCFTVDKIKEHYKSCYFGAPLLIVEKNILFFAHDEEFTYFSGPPFVDEDGQDDIMNKKGVPMFLSGALVKDLERTILWRMDYKKD
jgi:hypothetical protein